MTGAKVWSYISHSDGTDETCVLAHPPPERLAWGPSSILLRSPHSLQAPACDITDLVACLVLWNEFYVNNGIGVNKIKQRCLYFWSWLTLSLVSDVLRFFEAGLGSKLPAPSRSGKDSEH